ncbi:MAG: hypothetical protein RO469_05150 [Thermincola sp.]|nr:hypothetical protein [Thermincola sp.]MDT3702969.1 hypothetical protein [Thermincola sp.]
MNEQFKGKRFSDDIDKLLNGSGIDRGSRFEDDYATTENDDTKAEHNYDGMLELARAVVSVDYSTESKVRQGLLDKLLKQMADKLPPEPASSKDDELDEDELAQVAGGRALAGPKQGCALCECKLSRASIKEDTCPDCGHSRSCHQ